MKYMGSKNRIAKFILPIILKQHTDGIIFIDACCGGCNLIDKVPRRIPRYANDINKYLVALFNKLKEGWNPEDYYTKEFYNDVRENKDNYPDHIVGYIGFNCSYSGKWFGGFAGVVETKGGKRDYQAEAKKNILNQVEPLKDVTFSNKSVLDINPIKKSIIYFDIPYKGTTGYKDKFDHESFYEKCRDLKRKGHIIFVSEYNMPNDFVCVWEKEVSSSLSANGRQGGNITSVEKLFTI